MDNVAQPQTTHKPATITPPKFSITFPLNALQNAAETYVLQGGCAEDFEIIPTHIDVDGTPRGFVRGSNYRAVEAIQAIHVGNAIECYWNARNEVSA